MAFLIAVSCCYGQRKKIDSLLKAAPALNDTARMGAYLSLGKNYINISLDSATMYLQRAVAIARQYHNRKVEARSYSLLGVAEKNRGDYDKAITYHLSSLKISEELGDEPDRFAAAVGRLRRG